jgi:hypothetical protein
VTNEIFWVWRLFMTWSIPIYCHRPSRPSAFSSASPSAARAPSPSRPRRWNKGRRWHGRWRKMTWGGGWQWDSLGEDLCHGRWLVSVGSVWHISIWQTNEHILCTCISWYVYIIQLYTVYIYTYTYSSIELERKISWNVKITSSPITTRSFPWITAGFCGAHQSALASGRSKLLEGRRGSRSWASRVWPKKKPCPILDELWDDDFMIL